jgi:hypothetical protein
MFIGTIHGFKPVFGKDFMNINGVKKNIRTRLFNLCAMMEYANKSIEVYKK